MHLDRIKGIKTYYNRLKLRKNHSCPRVGVCILLDSVLRKLKRLT